MLSSLYNSLGLSVVPHCRRNNLVTRQALNPQAAIILCNVLEDKKKGPFLERCPHRLRLVKMTVFHCLLSASFLPAFSPSSPPPPRLPRFRLTQFSSMLQ